MGKIGYENSKDSAEQVKKTVENEAQIHNVTLNETVLENNVENALLNFDRTLDKQPGKVKRRLEQFMDSFLVDGEAVYAVYPGGEHTLLFTSKELLSGAFDIEYPDVEWAVEKIGGKIISLKTFYLEETTGRQFYEDLSKSLGSSELASLKLIDIGIPGYKNKSLFLARGEMENDTVIWNEKELNAKVQKERDEMERLRKMSFIFNSELDKTMNSRDSLDFRIPSLARYQWHNLLLLAVKELNAHGLKEKLDESNDIDIEYVDFGDNRKNTLLFDGIAEKFRVGDPVEIINEQMERRDMVRQKEQKEPETLNKYLSPYAVRFIAENKQKGTLGDLSANNLNRSFEGCALPLRSEYYAACRTVIKEMIDISKDLEPATTTFPKKTILENSAQSADSLSRQRIAVSELEPGQEIIFRSLDDKSTLRGRFVSCDGETLTLKTSLGPLELSLNKGKIEPENTTKKIKRSADADLLPKQKIAVSGIER
jgi:hypothetical protein